LLVGSIRYETLIDLPAIGIAGAPNAGKSSLLNALLGWERSIVSETPKTTRDVLSGVLTTDRFQCVLFDCAGLIRAADNTLDELAQQAAIEALQGCFAVIFCVDSTKRDPAEDVIIRTLIQPKNVIHVATKSDLLTDHALKEKARELTKAFNADFLPVSARTGTGLEALLRSVEDLIMHNAYPALREPARNARRAAQNESAPASVGLTARHKQAIVEAMESVRQAVDEVKRGNDEIAATMIRAACQAISQIEQQHIGEQVLDRIFSRFCIGK
jgi:tRNA modification GTPase